MDCSPPDSSVHSILQARILEWGPFPSPGDLPDAGMEPTSLMSPALASGSLPLPPLGKSYVSAGLAKKIAQVFLYILMEKYERVFWSTQYMSLAEEESVFLIGAFCGNQIWEDSEIRKDGLAEF